MKQEQSPLHQKNRGGAPHLFISVGEASGDALAATVIKALTHHHPDISIAAVTGPQMEEVGGKHLRSIATIDEIQVMGVGAVLSKFPQLKRHFQRVKRAILAANPPSLLLVDYIEFHLLLIKALRKKGYKGKIAQLVAPSVWAWRKGRARTLEKYADHLFPLFPFEKKYFNSEKLGVTPIGHPLAHPEQDRWLAKSEQEKVLLICPGSREKELKRNLPLQLGAAKIFLHLHPEYQLVISVAAPHFQKTIEEELAKRSLHATLRKKQACSNDPKRESQHTDTPNSLKKESTTTATLALATSGTVTLELALAKIPTVVTYALSPFEIFLFRGVFRIHLPHYCIVNIISQKTLFPEHYGLSLSPERIASSLLHLHNHLKTKERELTPLPSLLSGEGGAGVAKWIAQSL